MPENYSELLEAMLPRNKHVERDYLMELYYKYLHGASKEAIKKICPRFYMRLYREGLLAKIPNAPRSRYGDDPLKTCRERFPGCSRGKIETNEPALYSLLWRRGH